MTETKKAIFGLSSVPEYIEVAEEAVSALDADKVSVFKCFSAMLILTHLVDWLHETFTDEQKRAAGLPIGEYSQLRKALETENGELALVRRLANGFKHVRIVDPTGKIEGYGSGPYGVGPFGKPYLLIDLGEDREPKDRWSTAHGLASRALEWWKGRLKSC